MADMPQIPVGWVYRPGGQEKLSLPLSTVQKHCLVTGSTGWGKSGFLLSIMLWLLTKHRYAGLTLIDAKGETAGELLDHFLPAMFESHPHLRPEKVVVVAPFGKYGVPLGLFHPIPGLTHEVQAFIITKLIGSLVEGFGTRMTAMTSSLVRCVLAAEGIILDVHRCLVDDSFRLHLASRIQDRELVNYLVCTFEKEPSSTKEAVRARIEWLLLLPSIRAMLASRESVSGEDILEAPLAVVDLGGAPQGQVAVARFVGALIFQLVTAAVFNRSVSEYTPHRWLVADEWQELVKFAAEDVERLLSLARFKRVAVWLANQDLAQVATVSPSLAKSLLTNVALQVACRPDPGDIKHLVPLLPITGCRRDPQRPDRLLSRPDELKATLDALSKLPVRHALLADRVAGRAEVVRTLSVPYAEAHSRAAKAPTAVKERFRQGRFGIPMDELIRSCREPEPEVVVRPAPRPRPALQPPPEVSVPSAPGEPLEPPGASPAAMEVEPVVSSKPEPAVVLPAAPAKPRRGRGHAGPRLVLP